MASNGFSIFSLIPLGGRKGGSPSSKGIYVGMVTKGSSFPTKRLDGSPLQTEDYVKVDPETPLSDFPFTISGVTFSTKKDQAFYLGSNRWQIDPGAIQTTSETPTTNRDAESLNGSGTTQAQVNLQVANMIGKKKTIEVDDKDNLIDAVNYLNDNKVSDVTLDGDSLVTDNVAELETATDNEVDDLFEDFPEIQEIAVTNVKQNNPADNDVYGAKFINARKIAGYNFTDDVSAQEIQDATKELTATLKNKTMSADNNTFTDFTPNEFKSSAKATGTSNNDKFTTQGYVDDEIQKVIDSTFTFKGFISTTQPSENLKAGMFWYNANALPTTFPINVKTYDGTNWSSATSEYTPAQFDTWSFGENGYYWFGNSWNILDTSTSIVDNISIDRNNQNELEVKDEGISKDKLNSNVADNVTIEKDSTDGLRLKDEGITFAKLNPNLTKQSLANDYYFKFSDGTNTYYTKTIVDGENIDVYAITITNNKITAITLQETKGTLANGVLTFSSVEYAHDVFGDGFYVVGDDEILITISALQDILEKAGKVNDIKVAGVSQVKNKEANIQTIDNVEDNFYYAFKNGSTYYYTKSKATGSTAYYQFTYTDNVLTKIENKGNATVELNANRVPQITISSTIYTLDETKNDYYIINPKQKLPSIENETRDFTQAELDRMFEGFYANPNPVKYYTGNDAFIYNTSTSQGLTISGDYATDTPRTLWVQGKMGFFNCTLKGTAAANGSDWTSLGQFPVGKRPKRKFSIVAMVYNGNSNESAGGYVTTAGWVIIWTNAKTATNNYQVRLSFAYELED